MNLQIFGNQVQGKRARQEDSFRIEMLDRGRAALVVLADGLGGHPGGDIASRIAVDSFCRLFPKLREEAPGGPTEWMRESLLAAHRNIRQRQEEEASLKGMATTVVAAYFSKGRYWSSCVGDSYLMLLQEQQLALLNELHVYRGGLTSTVGFNLSKVDIADGIEVAAGARLLLASDGVDSLETDALRKLLIAAKNPESAVANMLAAVESVGHPHQDNTTLVSVFL